MSKYENLAKDVVEKVGGPGNINNVTHCTTRLRFELADESKADTAALKNTKGVISVMQAGGQYQVVIGTHVADMYPDVQKYAGLSAGKNPEPNESQKPLKDRILSFITAAISPSVMIVCGAGIIKGILALLTTFGWLAADSGINLLLSNIANAPFFFIPVLITYNVAKKMNANTFTGLAVGLALCMPALQGTDINLFGSVLNVTYTSTVMPAIFIELMVVYVERFLQRHLPDVIRNFMTPALILMFAVPIGFVLIGPLANKLADLIGIITGAIYNISPVLNAFVIGAFYQVLVVFGIHAAIILPAYFNVLAGTPDPNYGALGLVSFVVFGVTVGVYLKSKKKSVKEAALPSAISAFFGVTEPATYSVLLADMRTFVYTCIAGGISGIVGGIMNLKVYVVPGMGIFKIPGYINPENPAGSLIQALICIGVAIAAGFIITFILYKDKDTEETVEAPVEKTLKKQDIAAPVSGTVMPLEKTEDEAFASGALGQGIVIEPDEGVVKAPFDGTVITLFPTGHAVGVVSDSGCEVLIHVGMDTVKLEGKHFTKCVEQGDKVTAGQELLRFDLQALKNEGFCTQTPVIVTNTQDYADIVPMAKGEIKAGERVLTAII